MIVKESNRETGQHQPLHKTVRYSLLRSMEAICLSPHAESWSSLQQSFLGHIYRGDSVDRDKEQQQGQNDKTVIASNE